MDQQSQSGPPEQGPQPQQPPPGPQQGPPPGYQQPPGGYQQPPWPPSPDAKRQKDERMWAMFCHLASFSGSVGVPVGWIVGPLIVWLIKKDEYPLVDDQGKQVLNFQISMTIYGVISFFLVFAFFLGIPLLIGICVLDLVCTIMGAVKANRGEAYRYPLAIEFIK